MDHLAQLARREHHVHVADAAGGHLRPLTFVLLRRARHDRNDENILRPLVQLVGVIGLGQGPEHLLRRLACGKIRQHVGMEVLKEIDPARRTTGEHWQGNAIGPLALWERVGVRVLVDRTALTPCPSPGGRGEKCRLEPREQFRALFQDREVGGKVRVEYGVEAQPPQSGRHLAGHERARRIAETLAQGGADGRGGLHDDVLAAFQRRPDLVDLIALGDRTHGTDRRALPALHAGHRRQVVAEGRSDDRLETAVLREQRPHVLDLCANAHTTAALDALARVAKQCRRRRIDPLAGPLADVGDFADSQFRGQGLKLAVLATVAGLALAIMLRKQELDHGLAGVADTAGVCENLHPRRSGHGARSAQVPRPFNLDHTDAAGADRLQAFHVAERGNLDPRLPGRGQERGPFGDFDGRVIDLQVNHRGFLGLPFQP